MAKHRPGIPANFTFDVSPVQDLGDYLDEPGPTPLPARTRPEIPPREPARTTSVLSQARPEPAQNTDRLPAAPEPVQPVTQAPAAPARSGPTRAEAFSPAEVDYRSPKLKGPRREFNMTHESLRMVDELLDLLRCGSGQRDTKANELFHGLLLLVHDAMGAIDPHALPKRGRWGTPTARAYPLEIRNAFLNAIIKKHSGGAGSRPQ